MSREDEIMKCRGGCGDVLAPSQLLRCGICAEVALLDNDELRDYVLEAALALGRGVRHLPGCLCTGTPNGVHTCKGLTVALNRLEAST